MLARTTAQSKLQGLVEELERMRAFVEKAATEGLAAHEVERRLWEGVLALGRQLLGEFFRLAGNGDRGATVELPDGRRVSRLPEPHARGYRSIFGPFELVRAVYGSREGQKIERVPLDARLNLPASDYSYVLQDWSQALDSEHAFAQTGEVLSRILKLSLPVDSLERINGQMADSVDGFRKSRPAPDPKAEGELLVVTADNKGVPMRRPVERKPAGCQRKKGERANKKQMATVGCAYTVDPKIRTPQEVVAALFREPQRPKGPPPHAQQKRVWSSLRDPIASGVIEGACRYYIKDRMERAGMRWTVSGAQAMLDLRRPFLNGQWEEFQAYPIEQECRRLYPHLNTIQQMATRLAA
jgi:hypothetical protein